MGAVLLFRVLVAAVTTTTEHDKSPHTALGNDRKAKQALMRTNTAAYPIQSVLVVTVKVAMVQQTSQGCIVVHGGSCGIPTGGPQQI